MMPDFISTFEIFLLLGYNRECITLYYVSIMIKIKIQIF